VWGFAGVAEDRWVGVDGALLACSDGAGVVPGGMLKGAYGAGRRVLTFPWMVAILLAVGAVCLGVIADIFFEAAHAVESGNSTDAYIFEGDSADEGEDDSGGGFVGTFFWSAEPSWSLA
jgi:hypothetical protein